MPDIASGDLKEIDLVFNKLTNLSTFWRGQVWFVTCVM